MSARAFCECSWHGEFRSAVQAEYARRQHSCAHHRKLAERQARVVARKNASGTRRDCTHPIARHEHGTSVAYTADRCRCRPCRDAHAATTASRSKRRAYGWTPYVDAGPARAHVEALRTQGMGWRRIAIAAGVPTGAMSKLLYGVSRRGLQPSRGILRETESRILAVQLDLGAAVVVDGVGTHRRLQALVARGWSQSKLAGMLGIRPTNIGPIIHGRRPVQLVTARAVRELYDRLWDKPPPDVTRWDRGAALYACRQAKEHGWVPPLAWDDNAIDDPAASPEILEDSGPLVDQVLVERAIAGQQVKLSRAEKLEAVRQLVDRGEGVSAISRRLHLSGDRARALYAEVQAVTEVEVSA